VNAIDGAIFALVPRSVFGDVEESHLTTAANRKIALACDPLEPLPFPRPLSDAIGFAPLEPDTAVTASCGTLVQVERALPFGVGLLEERAYIKGPDGIVDLGTVVQIDDVIDLVSRVDGTVTEYDQVIEVELSPGAAHLIREGDGGTLVLNNDNAAIGLIVGVGDGCAYLAAIAPLLGNGQFHFLTCELAQRRNEEADMRDLLNDLMNPGAWSEPALDAIDEAKDTFCQKGQRLGDIQLRKAA